METVRNPKAMLIFVHGFGSSKESWNPLISLLEQDKRITGQFDWTCFSYPTAWFNFNPTHRIPAIKEIAESLRAFLDSQRFYGREITLIGHSHGGLVIQSYLAEVLQAGHGERLSGLRQVILIATPNLGSKLLSPLRRLLSLIARNPQEHSLRVFNAEIAAISQVIHARVIGAKEGKADTWPVPVHCFYGLQDGIVLKASACGLFSTVTPLDWKSFHRSANQGTRATIGIEVFEAVLEPSGHTSIFEVDRYTTTIMAEPGLEKQEFECTHGTTTRTVHSDNIAHIIRKVAFSPKNRCASPFSIRYRTKQGGYLLPMLSHDNEITREEREKYEDSGTEVLFKFRPKAQEEYTLKLLVYKGFDEEKREVHFHLGHQSYYNALEYTVDLSRYLAAGYQFSTIPTLYYHGNDCTDCDLWTISGRDTPLEPTKSHAAVSLHGTSKMSAREWLT